MLVSPPRDEDVYGYLGPQRRWVQLLMSSAFLLAGYSVLRFALRGGPWLWPMLGVVGINVVAAALSALSGLNARRVTATSHRAVIRIGRRWSTLRSMCSCPRAANQSRS